MAKRVFKKYGKILFLISAVLIMTRVFSESINAQPIALWVQKAGIWGPTLVTLLIAASFIVAPLSCMPFLIAGYLVFGQRILFYHYLAATFAAIIDFWIAKKWGRVIVQKMIGENNLKKIDQFTQIQNLKTVFFLRVFQFQMHDVVSYGLGLTKIKFSSYLLASILGPVPWLSIWYLLIRNQVYNLKDFLFWFSLSYLPFWGISFLLLLRWKLKKS